MKNNTDLRNQYKRDTGKNYDSTDLFAVNSEELEEAIKKSKEDIDKENTFEENLYFELSMSSFDYSLEYIEYLEDKLLEKLNN